MPAEVRLRYILGSKLDLSGAVPFVCKEGVMWRLVVGLVWVMFVVVGGCAGEGGEGDLCDQHEDCDDGLLCASEVLSCQDDGCWGTCARPCDHGSSCDGGEVCEWVGDARVCRPDDYQDPR